MTDDNSKVTAADSNNIVMTDSRADMQRDTMECGRLDDNVGNVKCPLANDNDDTVLSPASTDPPPTTAMSPLDGGWGWMVVIGSALVHFLVVGLGRSFGVFYVELREMYGRSAFQTSMVGGIFNTMRMVFGPVTGVLCDRYTTQRVVIVGGLILAVGCIISSYATGVIFLYLSFGMIAGFGSCLVFTPSYVIVGKYFDKNKGKAMAMSTLGSGIGTLAFAPIITLLLDSYMFCGTILIIGAMMLNNLVAGALYRPLYKNYKQIDVKVRSKEKTELHWNGHASAVDEQSKLQKFKAGLILHTSIMTNLTFLVYGFQILAMSICIQTFLVYLPSLSEERGSSKKLGAILVSIVGASDMVGRFVFGFLFDLHKVRNRRRLFHAYLGILVGSFTLVMGWCYTYTVLVAMCVVFGFVEAGFHSQRATIVSEFVSKDKMSSTVGYVILFQGIGNLAGPPVAGALYDHMGSYSICYFFSGSCLVVTSVLFLVDYYLLSRLCSNNKQPSEQSHVTSQA